MGNRIVLEGNAFYEVDEECVKKKEALSEKEKGSNSGKKQQQTVVQREKNRTSQ